MTQGTEEGGSDFSSLAGNLAPENSFASKVLLPDSGFTFVSKEVLHTPSLEAQLAPEVFTQGG